MKKLLDRSAAAGFAPACAFESGEEWQREAVAHYRATRRWRGAVYVSGSALATLVVASLLMVL